SKVTARQAEGMVAAIEVEGLRKTYVERRLWRVKRVVTALDSVTFAIERGTMVALLGPNGAGKSTTVRILSTLLLPDGGTARVMGHDVVKEASSVRRVIGVMLDPEKGHFGRLTGLENLVFYGVLHGLTRSDARSRAVELLEQFGLGDARDRPVEGYSKGMKARLAICRVLIHDPEVLILDEPTAGLDPISAREVRERLKGLKREGRTVLVTTHNLWEAEELSDRLIVLNRGRVIAEGTPEEVKRAFGLMWNVELEVSGNLEGLKLGWETELGISERGRPLLKVMIREDPSELVPLILSELRSRGVQVLSVSVREPTLEEAFVRAVGGA
ncbi:MAG: ABC transporter ATP-binding protein, partial [Nitrososphaerota archaeon]